jgi:hypothetical protein
MPHNLRVDVRQHVACPFLVRGHALQARQLIFGLAQRLTDLPHLELERGADVGFVLIGNAVGQIGETALKVCAVALLPVQSAGWRVSSQVQLHLALRPPFEFARFGDELEHFNPHLQVQPSCRDVHADAPVRHDMMRPAYIGDGGAAGIGTDAQGGITALTSGVAHPAAGHAPAQQRQLCPPAVAC